MTIHDTIVTVASLALMAWIVYIVYRHLTPCSASPDQTA